MMLTKPLAATAALALGLFCLAPAAYGRTQNQQTSAKPVKSKHHRGKSAAGEYGSGAGDAAGDAAKGAGDYATLHPIKGTESVGKGAAKGTGKAIKGTGKILTHPF